MEELPIPSMRSPKTTSTTGCVTPFPIAPSIPRSKITDSYRDEVLMFGNIRHDVSLEISSCVHVLFKEKYMPWHSSLKVQYDTYTSRRNPIVAAWWWNLCPSDKGIQFQRVHPNKKGPTIITFHSPEKRGHGKTARVLSWGHDSHDGEPTFHEFIVAFPLFFSIHLPKPMKNKWKEHYILYIIVHVHQVCPRVVSQLPDNPETVVNEWSLNTPSPKIKKSFVDSTYLGRIRPWSRPRRRVCK